MSVASEWVALEPLVQRIHQDDEQQRSERVALTQAAKHWEAAVVPNAVRMHEDNPVRLSSKRTKQQACAGASRAPARWICTES